LKVGRTNLVVRWWSWQDRSIVIDNPTCMKIKIKLLCGSKYGC
jgi:hypothetical protein